MSDLETPSFTPVRLNIAACSALAEGLCLAAKKMGYSRLTLLTAVAMISNGLSGDALDDELDVEMRAFLAERFDASATALRAGLQ
ncbi:hypothetical protein [Shinella pollutisoli]|uniref:Uncharacterized protein n=1 Tax=Shinella pollutisoli TaxID=2250594 RepID=A0ABV7DKQ7_9HYPH|nr:hypothetical protein [Shinella pollutisoli]